MKDPIKTADNAVDIKSQIIPNQVEKNTESVDQNADVKPSIEDADMSNNVTVKLKDIKNEENSQGDSEIKAEGNNVLKQENDGEISEHNIKSENMETGGTGDSIKMETVKTETNTDGKPVTGEEVKTMTNVPAKRRRVRSKFRPTKRRRLLARLEAFKMAQATNVAAENISSPEAMFTNDLEYCLTVMNLPNNWSFMDIKNYIDTQCGPVDEIEMVKDDETGNGAIRLSYPTETECKEAMKKLQDEIVEGKNLSVSMNVIDLSECDSVLESTESPVETPQPPGPSNDQQNEAPTPVHPPFKPDLDVWEIDPKGTYGLKESFLKSLGITPPLDKWVHVSNFRCEKSDLRDVLEMAGTVLMCSVFTKPPRYANVMYTHPLEAAQAVSMMNGVNFYGDRLKVVMQQCPADIVLLAKGLEEIGPGLGANGKPIRNILKHYERYVTNQSASINRSAFEDPPIPNGNLVENEEFQACKAHDFTYVDPELVEKIMKGDESKKSAEEIKQTAGVKAAKVAKSNVQVTKSNVQVKKTEVKISKADVEPPGTKSPEPKIVPQTKTVPKINVAKVHITKTSPPIRSPIRHQGPQNFQARNGPGFGPFGPRPGPVWSGPDPRMQRPFGPGPGPRPVWSGPGPRGGPMHGPGPMRPMGGPMPGPMQGPMPGPMQGSMPGPMQSPMQNTMAGPMQNAMAGPMQNAMAGPMQNAMAGPMQNAMAGPMQNAMAGPMQNTMLGSMQNGMVGAMPGPMQNAMQGSMPMMNPMQNAMQGFNPNLPVKLHLNNLPPSTTYGLLCDKMASCGQVVSIQLTTPGNAVVTFANKMQADRCYQTYNNICIEGCVIQVVYE